ncbi:glycosyltransferase family 4 protein [Longimicrobium sp.]|uniref:glycosyltransferase family 4 protein n=1 Tax=Longimicrobium sp. TaxID=2029185 RepID=UPI002E2EF298|nr:glycosyltransferase family 4 protein [Longimicrobium sp.]HEX6042117.1 glycosyltransferase family 4 protein [Longimicrobium sp.]
MRILFANDGVGDAGGVQNYLAAVMPALVARGHSVAFLHLDPVRPDRPSPAPADAPHFGMAGRGRAAAVAEALAWKPDVAFVHNMRPLEVDGDLIDAGLPVVKMMHGYFGTCVSGLKSHAWPRPVLCGKPLGAGCFPVYASRKCGQMRPGAVLGGWRWANDQNDLFDEYAAIVTASRHMRDEYVRNGAPADRVHAIPLFPTLTGAPADAPRRFRVLFLGRMTAIKGGDVLIRAVADASDALGRPIPLTMAGDGPQRDAWERLAGRLGVDATFTGWVNDAGRAELLRWASVLAVPSVWPEPFGLVGLEAGVFGVPSVAFDVGGIDDWLTDGVNGWLVPGDPPSADEFAAALARAARAPDVLARMRTGAREVAERMTLDRHVDAVERVLLSAAASGARAA